jgi:transposase
MKGLKKRDKTGHALNVGKHNNPGHDMNTTTQAESQSNQRIYVLKPVSVGSGEHPVTQALAELNQAQAGKDKAAKRRQRQGKPAKAEAEERLRPAGEVGCAKTIVMRPPVAPSQPLHPHQRPKPTANCSVIKLGMDVDSHRITVCTQYDYSVIKPAATFTPETLVAWVKERIQEGHVVWTVYEACGFGYTLHWALVGAGAQSLVIAPVRLDPSRRRKNDGLDARALCTRLTRYVDGQKTELPIIRVPSVEEQRRRESGRQREFWRGEVQRLASHGRALRLEHEHQGLSGRWWTDRQWKKLAPGISPFVRELLELLRPQLAYGEKQIQALTEQLEQRVRGPLPTGLGAMTMALFQAEMCDVKRFNNRKQVGSYIGCCPSQYASGETARMGGIDRHGNKHLRVLLVEAVWRLVRYQPGWLAYRRLLGRLSAGAAMRKKTVVALARQLAIDLWRVGTGRATWAELGFAVK